MVGSYDDSALRGLVRRALARARADGALRGAGRVEPVRRGRAAAGSVVLADLEGLERGATVRLQPGTRVTPLARDEAWRRGIRLEEAES